MIILNVGGFDPQQWEAYRWERANNLRYKVDSEVDWEKSVNYIYDCADLFKIEAPRYYFLPKSDPRMEDAWGTASGERRVNLREDAFWTTAIHEMAHIIKNSCWRNDSVKDENDWSPHGSIFCGILAILYEEFGLWPEDKEHLTTVEINEGHQDPDFYYMRRQELWDMGIMLPKDLSFEANMTNWLKQHNRIGRINRAIGTEAQRIFEMMLLHEEDPLWAKARELGAIEPCHLFGDEVDDEEFLDMLLHPAHGYSLDLQHKHEATPEGCKKLRRKLKKGINETLEECRQQVIDEAIGQYNDYLLYNYPEVMSALQEEEEECEWIQH